MRKRNILSGILSAMLVFGSIAACGGKLITYKGDKVTQENLMVHLEDGNQQGIWRTNELAIKYQYHMTPETLEVSGNILPIGWSRPYSHIAVYLLFLDNQGIVIENALIYSEDNYGSIVVIPMNFEKTIPIPVGVRTISFAYSFRIWHP
jgi:hypothetical protein